MAGIDINGQNVKSCINCWRFFNNYNKKYLQLVIPIQAQGGKTHPHRSLSFTSSINFLTSKAGHSWILSLAMHLRWITEMDLKMDLYPTHMDWNLDRSLLNPTNFNSSIASLMQENITGGVMVIFSLFYEFKHDVIGSLERVLLEKSLL